MPGEACRVSCHLPDLIGFPQLFGSSKRKNQKLFCLIGLFQYKSWHRLTRISSERNNNNIKFPPTTMALVLFGWVVTPPVSSHQRKTNLQIYTVFLGIFFSYLFPHFPYPITWDSTFLRLLFFKDMGAYLNINFYNLGKILCLLIANCHRTHLTIVNWWQNKE